MRLEFLGNGSAFFTEEGNTSAYYIEDDKLLLIDCGELTWSELRKRNILEGISEIYVAITHTHSDHVGSLGSLANYTAFILRKPLYIIVEDTLREDLTTLLRIFGIPENKNYFEFINPKELKVFSEINSMLAIEADHGESFLKHCYSFLFYTSDEVIYYSGDSKDVMVVLQLINNPNLSKMYVDVTTALPHVHLSLTKLAAIVPISLRKKICCMHFNSFECIEEAIKLGFDVK